MKAGMRPRWRSSRRLLPDGRGTDVCRELRTGYRAPIRRAVRSRRGEGEGRRAGRGSRRLHPPSRSAARSCSRACAPSSGEQLPPPSALITIGELFIDLEKAAGHDGRSPGRFDSDEYDLLRVLAKNEGKLLTHTGLLREVWGPAFQEESNYLPRSRVAYTAQDRT